MYKYKKKLSSVEQRFGVLKKVILLIAITSTSSFVIESEKLYKHCVVCHGEKGNRKAIKRSPQLSLLKENELNTNICLYRERKKLH